MMGNRELEGEKVLDVIISLSVETATRFFELKNLSRARQRKSIKIHYDRRSRSRLLPLLALKYVGVDSTSHYRIFTKK